MEDFIQTAKDFIIPREKTLGERCKEFIWNNPTLVAKGVTIGVIAWMAAPVVYTVVAWSPYIGAGYYVYTTAQPARQTYNWYQWGKRQLLGKL